MNWVELHEKMHKHNLVPFSLMHFYPPFIFIWMITPAILNLRFWKGITLPAEVGGAHGQYWTEGVI
jgi:hypothetical protein